jgi:hypothetical protein
MSAFDPKELDARLQQCAAELPAGYTVTIHVEAGAGWVDLTGPDGDPIDYPCNHEYGLIEAVTDALDYAKETAAGKR